MSKTMKPGDRFTIDGCGRGAKGQNVIGDFNSQTGRKCRAVELTVFVVPAPSKNRLVRIGGKKKP